jgi:hypothetical protein
VNRHERRAREAQDRRRGGQKRKATSDRKVITMQLPGEAGVPRLLSFIQAEEHLARRNVEAPQFSTFFTALDRAYDAAREAMAPQETDLLILQWFLFCHRSLLGAASMIVRGAPNDTAAITRRALEAARAAFAVCYDATNAAAWMAFEKRFARWKARETDDKPARFSPKFTLPKDHARLDELGKWLGMLSDSGAHFTPEVMENFDFQRQGEKASSGSSSLTVRCSTAPSARAAPATSSSSSSSTRR